MTSKTKIGVKKAEKSAARDTAAPVPAVLFKVTLEVNHLERARAFYEELLGMKGKKLPGSRVHFECGQTVLQIADVSASGPSHPCARSVCFAVPNLEAVHKRAKKLKCLSVELVHDRPGGAIYKRPWGEKSFYADDPWFNSLCFVQAGTEDRG